MSALYIILGLVFVFLFWLWLTYNGLVKSRYRTDDARADIDVQLKRRYDLIPNLVKTVKGYAAHEKELFEKITKLRSEAIAVPEEDIKKQAKVENEISKTLRSLFAVAENYPQLKANENFAKLQDELVDTENKILYARRFYNANVRDYNIKVEVFPTNLFAKMLGFSHRDFFELEEEMGAAEAEKARKGPDTSGLDKK